MKVVYVDAGAEWRGGQSQLLLLATVGPPPHAVIVRPDAPVRRALEAAGLRVVPVGMSGRWRGGRPLRAALRDLAPDVVAAHDGHGAALCLRVAAAPVVVHRRTDFVPSWLGYRRYRRAAEVVAVSEAVAAILRRGGIERVSIVYDGVDGARFAAAVPDRAGARGLGVPDDAPWVVAAGALVPHKGHRHLVDALVHLPGWHAVILGDGPLRQALADQARARGVADRLHLAGRVADVGPWLAAADRFVHPSVGEGVGQVVLEAAFAGAAIVTTSAGGLAELGVGRPCAPGDGRALADAIHAAPIRAAAPDLAPFTAARMAARTWEVYRRAATRGVGG